MQARSSNELGKSLDFGQGVSYKVTVRKRHFHDASVVVDYEPKDRLVYEVKLVRFLVDVPITHFNIDRVKGSKALRVSPQQNNTEGYTDTAENSPAVRGPVEKIYRPEVPANICFIAGVDSKGMVVFQETKQIKGAQVHVVADSKETLETVAEKYEIDEGEVYQRNKQLFKDGKRELRRGMILDIADPLYVGTLFKVQERLGGLTALTTTESLNFYPSMDLNGNILAFASTRDGRNGSILYIDPSRSFSVAQLEDSGKLNLQPSVGPNLQFAFARIQHEEGSQIFTINPNERYPNLVGQGEMPQLSPDGRKICFLRQVSKTNPNHQLFIMDSDGSGVVQLTQNTDYDIKDPRWNPTSDLIAFSSNRAPDSRGMKNYDIWVINPLGESPTQITTNGSHDDQPAWDPTGTSIYFRSNRGEGGSTPDVGKWGIWKVVTKLPPR